MDLLVTKWIALEGAVILGRDFETRLKSQFPCALVDAVAGMEEELSVEEEIKTARFLGAKDIQPLGQGGIFTALWLLAERIQTGLDADLRKIPVRQEIIEICEYFDLNPYHMLSGGSLLICARQGQEMVSELTKLGISAVLIGRTTGGNDRLIHNREHIRYLDRPQRDELYKIYKEGWRSL